MNPGHWNPDWGYTFIYDGTELKGVLAQCPYCGYVWTYTGGDKHYATCPGKYIYEGNTYPCHHKVRLHPYLVELDERYIDRFNQYRRGKTPRSRLEYPNKNYDYLSEEIEQ